MFVEIQIRMLGPIKFLLSMFELVLTVPHKNMIGKNVIVIGALFHGFTGHHHTDVLMRVQSISLAVSDPW